MPPRLPQNDLNLIASARTSSTVRSFALPLVIAQVSGLWQNLQRILQPCIKMTKRTPGPSTLPKLSVEWINPVTFPMFSIIISTFLIRSLNQHLP